jgi:hypothetical protein
MTEPDRWHAAGMPLFAALMRPECYPHPVVGTIRVIETHISWVVLTGPFAYKIKKPVNLGFADFSTLGLRQYYCEQELQLNRRFAPELYLDVVSIRGDIESPRIGGDGPVLDYAVKMHEFSQELLASRALAAGTFGATGIDALAALIADYHAGAVPVRAGDPAGQPGSVFASAQQNFDQMLPLITASADDGPLRSLHLWTEREFAAREAAFAARQRGGFVRDCHGDLHLGNVVLLDGRPVPFDCIEFNEELRWIDVMSEVAFLAMDLEDRGRSDLAWRFLNRYLETTGDYAGLEVLRFYLVYRALVRAKVHLMRSRQPPLGRAEKSHLAQAFHGYLALARSYAAPQHPALVLAHGLSGSGKTTATQPLVEALGAIRLRSDLERKRLHGLAPLAASGSGPGGGIYTAEATAATYRHLGALAESILDAGFPVVVDAAFLKRAEREAFRAIAERTGASYLILDFHAPLEVLRARVAERAARADDASEADLAVLERQIATREPLTPAETAAAFAVDATGPVSHEMWHPFAERLRRPDGGNAPVASARAAGRGDEKNA